MSIRKARWHEIVAVHAIHTAADAVKISFARRVARALTGGVLFVIEDGGKTAGAFMIARRRPHFYRDEWFTPAPAVYLHSMAVHPRFQKRGLGRAALLDAARLYPAIRLDAVRGAGAFYEKCGFTRVHAGATLDYYEKISGR